jgi:hypothetical protein
MSVKPQFLQCVLSSVISGLSSDIDRYPDTFHQNTFPCHLLPHWQEKVVVLNICNESIKQLPLLFILAFRTYPCIIRVFSYISELKYQQSIGIDVDPTFRMQSLKKSCLSLQLSTFARGYEIVNMEYV